MDETRSRTLADRARVARLATTRPDGRTDLVPFVFAFHEGDVVFAVDHKPKRTTRLQRLANIAANPEVTVLFDHHEEDWERLWWVRMRGVATEHEPGAQAGAVDALVARYPQYTDRRPVGPVVRITPTEWAGWEAMRGR